MGDYKAMTIEEMEHAFGGPETLAPTTSSSMLG